MNDNKEKSLSALFAAVATLVILINLSHKGYTAENALDALKDLDPPKNIDLYLTEGTMVERSSLGYPDEKSVQEAISAVVRDRQNVTFMVSSARNIDRQVSVVKAFNSNKKKLVVDVYNAWVLDMVKKKAPDLPTIDWDNILVFNHPNQLNRSLKRTGLLMFTFGMTESQLFPYFSIKNHSIPNSL